MLDQEAGHRVHDARPVRAGEHEHEVARPRWWDWRGSAPRCRASVATWSSVAVAETQSAIRNNRALVSRHEQRRGADRQRDAQRRRPVRRPGADHPRGPRPGRRGRGHRDRRRARRPQEHGVPAGRHPRGAPPGRADRRTAASTASASASSGWPARPRRGSTWSRRPGRSAAQLAADTGETVNIAVLSESSALYLDQVAGSSALQPHNWVGQHIPLHATSNGKVLLSGLDDRGARPAAGTLPRTPARRSPEGRALRAELEQVREQGYAARGRRARGRADRGGRPDPQRPRRRGRLDERLGPDVPALRRGSRRSSATLMEAAAGGLPPPGLGSPLGHDPRVRP